VSGFEIASLVLAGLFALGGIRSLARWLGRPLDSPSLRDQVLFAVNVTGRVGLWFALAGMFVGTALIEEFETFRWYLLVPLGMATLQLVSTVLLGRSAD
jgi:hypothetical protein